MGKRLEWLEMYESVIIHKPIYNTYRRISLSVSIRCATTFMPKLEENPNIRDIYIILTDNVASPQIFFKFHGRSFGMKGKTWGYCHFALWLILLNLLISLL